jgi:2,3-dihydroxybenzoate-AMP ligase
MVILCSSGSSCGVPKLIARTHRGFLAASHRFGELWGCEPGVRFGLVSLITHAAALGWGVHPVLLSGGTLVVPGDRRPGNLLRVFREHKVQVTFLVPSQARSLCSELAANSVRLPESLGLFIFGGEVLDPNLALELSRQAGALLQNTYGMSEGFCTATARDGLSEILEGSIGQPCFEEDEIKIVDSNNDPVLQGEKGVLWVRSPAGIQGYFGSPQEYRECFSADGFFNTGDFVRGLGDSRLAYVGRAKFMINRGGIKIFPEEIESGILRHPAVESAVVVGVPDQAYGERICAAVHLKTGARLTLQALRQFLSSAGIGKWNQPDELKILPQIPMGSVGKRDRRAVEHQFEKR